MVFVHNVIFSTTRKSVIRPLLYELMRLFLAVQVVSGAISSALGTVSRGAVRKPGNGALGGLPTARVGSTCQPPNYIRNNRLLSAELWTSQITPLRATTL